jgi:hypothetical protein
MAGNLNNSNGANLLASIPQLLGIFLGTGTSTGTKTTTKSGSPDATAALKNILGSSGPSTDAAVSNALDLALRAGIPSIGSAERGSGIFNSSATAENMNQVLATALAKAAELNLNQQNTVTGQKLAAAQELNNSTGSTTESSSGKTSGQLPAWGLPATILGGIALNSLLSNSGKKQGDLSSSLGTSDLGSAFGFNAPTNSNAFNSLGNTVLSDFMAPVASAMQNAGVTNLETGVTSGGWNTATDALKSIGMSAAPSLIGSGLNAIGDYASQAWSAVTGDKVICTRMHELGYLDTATYEADGAYGVYIATFYPRVLTWYHSWAKPFVAKYMHNTTLGSKVIIQLLRPIVYAWALAMKVHLNLLGVKLCQI